MTSSLERAQIAARREDDLNRDLADFQRNVRVGRIEPDHDFEQRLREEIAEAERASKQAMAEHRREREMA
jgi:homoserine acetyltransferase